MSARSRRKLLYCVLMKIISLIIFVVSFSLLISCSKPEAPEYLGFRDFSVDNFSMDSALLRAQLAFYNPNTFAMELKRGDVNVFLDNKLANHYLLDSTIDIPRKDTFYVPLNLHISPKLLISSALSMLMNNNKIRVRMEGNIRVKRGALGFTVPINYEVMETIK
jgi:LEA14-like dessication related protein